METILTLFLNINSRQADYKLSKLGFTHNYLTKRHSQLAATKRNLNFATKRPFVAGILFYNSLPDSMYTEYYLSLEIKIKNDMIPS